MDWSNERYVRLYVRDTVTWKLLKWEGQTVLTQLMRKLDRAGVLDLGGCTPYEAIEALTELPENIIKTGFNRCIEKKVFVVKNDCILMPNFLDAQETPQSDAERARASRERRRDKAKLQSVTKSDDVSQHNVTEPSQNVTKPSHPVTACHSYPSVPSVLNRAEPSYARAREDPLLKNLKSEPWHKIAKIYSSFYEKKRGMLFQQAGGFERQFMSLAVWCTEQAERDQISLESAVTRLWENYFADEKEAKNDWTPTFAANQPGRWYNPAQINSSDDDYGELKRKERESRNMVKVWSNMGDEKLAAESQKELDKILANQERYLKGG